VKEEERGDNSHDQQPVFRLCVLGIGLFFGLHQSSSLQLWFSPLLLDFTSWSPLASVKAFLYFNT